ncbi:MAG: hypothetical protein U9O65_10815 [Thermotogota bacterium]|nr:hypothetical protein [Thermotogota bacterium]
MKNLVITLLLFFLLIASGVFCFDLLINSEGYEDGYSISFELTPGIAFSNFSGDFVTKYNWGWGRPTNPAENAFYLQDNYKPFLNVLLQVEHLGLKIDFEVPFQYEYGKKLRNVFDIFSFNFPSLMMVDMNFPYLGYIEYENELFDIAVGRFPIKWGWSEYPLTISPTTYQDNFTFTANFYSMKYYFHAISSYPLLSSAERDIQENFSDQHTPGIYFDDPSKYIFAHRVEFDHGIFEWGLGELNVVGGKTPDIIDANPLMIFHNTYGEGYSNVVVSLDGKLELRDDISVYGEISFDDYESLTESGSGYKPTAYGFNLGGRYNFGDFTFWIEYDHISEWMYVTNYLPYLRVNVRQFHLNNGGTGRLLVDYPVGFMYGPDARMTSLGIRGSLYDMKISAKYNYLVKGTVVDDSTTRWKWFWDSWTGNVTEDAPDPLPKAPDETYHIFLLNLEGEYFEVQYKTVDLLDHSFGIYLKYTFGFGNNL